MGTWTLGLRAKSMLALLLACLLALIPVGLVGWQMLDAVRNHFGTAYLRNFILLKRQQILAPVVRELALSQRLAQSQLTRHWARHEEDASRRTLFFDEAEGYRQDFRDRNYFIALRQSGDYYFVDTPDSSLPPRYRLQQDKAADAWFYRTLQLQGSYDINVNYDEILQTTKVWFNCLIRDGDRALGLLGSTLDLGAFIAEFIDTAESGLTPIIVAANGAIQAHHEVKRIATNQANADPDALRLDQTLAGQLRQPQEREQLARLLQQARDNPESVPVFPVHLDGKPQLLALAWMPELRWFIVAAMDVRAAQVLDETWVRSGGALLVLLLVSLLLGFGYAVERLLLQPLRKLQASARALALGNYDLVLPVEGQDEMGDLARTFSRMAQQIREYTTELEDRVLARTEELAWANRKMAQAHQQIKDSIEYASLIQGAILPRQQLEHCLPEAHFVLWQPRDLVGGDFYLFRETADGYLIGVVDCAGHGVPGALMTMLAHAAFDQAITSCGPQRPATILQETDRSLGAMLQACELPRAIATNLDAGLVFIDPARAIVRFSGARIGLYWSDGETLEQLAGHRRAIADRRSGHYSDTEIPLRPDCTYTLSSDGFLDQAGGDKGYGFGDERFAGLLRANARRPMAEQMAAFKQALADYQGEHPQRDDITVLSFRFNRQSP